MGAVRCLHPYCPLAGEEHPADWKEAVELLRRENVFTSDGQAARALTTLEPLGPPPTSRLQAAPVLGVPATIPRLLAACPCLVTQLDHAATADSIVHLCAVTMGEQVTAANVEEAFDIQHPARFDRPPVRPYTNPGELVEALCCEILRAGGVSEMPLDGDGWPVWGRGFVRLGRGKLHRLGSFGDVLIPAAPTNILVSCKAVAARERLLNSGIRVDTVGFGFFKDAKEFWSTTRINVLRRFGFTVIYMPRRTFDLLKDHLGSSEWEKTMNVNGSPLFRPLSRFVTDMAEVTGRVSLDL